MHKVTLLLHSRKIKALIFPQWGSHRRLETWRGLRAVHPWWFSHFVSLRLHWPHCLLLTSLGIRKQSQMQIIVWYVQH